MFAMTDISFNLKPITAKPSRRFRKGSKYDPIVDAFMSGMNRLVIVDVVGKDANYLRSQLIKRIEARNLIGLKVSVVNDTCYLEKV